MPEKLELKRQMITQLDEVAPEDTIIASNSSSYSISEIIDGLKLSHAQRILSAHSCENYPSIIFVLLTLTLLGNADWPPETPGMFSHTKSL